MFHWNYLGVACTRKHCLSTRSHEIDGRWTGPGKWLVSTTSARVRSSSRGVADMATLSRNGADNEGNVEKMLNSLHGHPKRNMTRTDLYVYTHIGPRSVGRGG